MRIRRVSVGAAEHLRHKNFLLRCEGLHLSACIKNRSCGRCSCSSVIDSTMITILIIIIIVVNVSNLSHVINSLVELCLAVVYNKRQNASYEHVTCECVNEMTQASRRSHTTALAGELRNDVGVRGRAPLKQALGELGAKKCVSE